MTKVDVTDVLRIHAADRVVRCFAVPRRRPSPTKALRTSQNYGFASMNPRPTGVGATSGGPPVSRADAVSSRLRELAERYARTAGAGPIAVRFATDALVALGVAAGLLALALVAS